MTPERIQWTRRPHAGAVQATCPNIPILPLSFLFIPTPSLHRCNRATPFPIPFPPTLRLSPRSLMAGECESETLGAALADQIRVNGKLADATLTAAGELRWRLVGADGGERFLRVEDDVLGVEVEGSTIKVKAFGEEMKGGICVCGNGGSRMMSTYELEMVAEEAAAIRWGDRLRNCISSLGRPKRLFIILNPYGGKRSARKIFDDEIKPLIEAADIYYTLQETKYRLHAQEIARNLDITKYDGLVCVSGDGILVEVVNGLLQREDWESAIKVPLGIIPAGTGNGMAKSLLDSVGDVFSVANATFAVIRGHKHSLDVTTVLQGETKFFSVLMLSWGLIADIDIESEKYRWMGSARLDFYSFLRAVNLRKYHGQIQFLPAPGYEEYGKPIEQSSSGNGQIEIPIRGQEDDSNSKRCGYQGPLTEFEGLEWRTVEGPFVSVWLNNVPWASESVMSAPEAKFSDGYLDAVITRDCPKLALVSSMLKMNDGSHVKSPYVMYLKVRAIRLQPGQQVGNPSKGGIIDSDGEVIARGEGTFNCHQQDLMSYGPPIQLTVEKGLATIFYPR